MLLLRLPASGGMRIPWYSLRPYQQRAPEDVTSGLSEADRGSLIMACGTGKTFVSLKIAEEMAGAGGKVLFLVPSLALLSQSLTEWIHHSTIPMHCFAVCSDSDEETCYLEKSRE